MTSEDILGKKNLLVLYLFLDYLTRLISKCLICFVTIINGTYIKAVPAIM